jgi:glycosyltransferase involved in cell wall biosynthesis
MAESSGRIVNSLKGRGHAVNVIHLGAAPGLRPSDENSSAEDSAELFAVRRGEMDGAILVGFGGGVEGYMATLWAKWLYLKSVVMFRGNDFERGVHDMRRGWVTHFILNEADVVCAVSGEMAARIRALRKNGQAFHTPNGIDAGDWVYLESDRINAAKWKKEYLPDDRPVVGLFGQLKRKKGLDLAISLFTAGGFGKKAYLMTVGDLPAPAEERLKNECASFWRAVPYQSRESLPVYYLLADVVFIPSYYDGTPNVLLEAMALGKVVVASRAGGMPDLITDGVNGFLFAPGDQRGAVSAMERAMGKEAGMANIGANARKTVVEKFTPAHEADVIEQALQTAAGS